MMSCLTVLECLLLLKRMMMQVYFGGSFDPVHEGHLAMMKRVYDTLKVHRVDFSMNFLPTAGNPLKGAPTPAMHRLAILSIACELLRENGVQAGVDRTEIDSPLPNYTIDTLRILREREVGRIVLMMGADSLVDLPKWKDGLQLPSLASIWAFDRVVTGAIPAQVQVLMTDDVAVFLAGNKPIYHDGSPIITISSTQIRMAIAQGQHPPCLPMPIYEYIQQHMLYGRNPA